MPNSFPLRLELKTVAMDRTLPNPALVGIKSLTEAVCRGDEEAFNIFYDEYSPRVFRFLIVVTAGDEELARELHQSVMIQSARKLKVFETDKQLWAWLTEVARNKWRDVWRKRARESKLIETLPAPAKQQEQFESERLQQVLMDLSKEDRELVESFYFDKVSQSELASRSGRTVKAIQCALARIRNKLKQLVGKGRI